MEYAIAHPKMDNHCYCSFCIDFLLVSYCEFILSDQLPSALFTKYFQFGKDTRIMAPLQLSQCYELMGTEIEVCFSSLLFHRQSSFFWFANLTKILQVRGDAISESLEISRKFHAKQRESRKEAMTKASQKTTRVKPSDVLLHLVPEVRQQFFSNVE